VSDGNCIILLVPIACADLNEVFAALLHFMTDGILEATQTTFIPLVNGFVNLTLIPWR
jgi:hypothetical protein